MPQGIYEADGGGDAELYEGGEGGTICEVVAVAGIGVDARVEVVFEPGVGGALR